MEDYQTWRDFLSNLIKERRERARIAKATGVDALTLASWATHATSPTSHQLHRLLQAIPHHQMLLHALIVEEFEEFDTDPIEASASPIPITFPARVLEILANAPEDARFWSICTAVLHEAVHQLAPAGRGISFSVVQCMPPSSPQEHIHCLREYIALGTSPWLDQVEMRTRFLGAESLAGTAVSSALSRIIDDVNQEPHPTTYLPEYAMSAAAFPIAHSNRIAGCFLAASTQAGYFSSATHQHLMQNYAALLALAFSPANFYAREQIALQIMPPLQVQQSYLSTFQQRVLATLQTAFSVNRSLSYLEAQQHVYAQIAQELLQIQPHA